MHKAIQHAVGVLFMACVFLLGRFFVRNPERMQKLSNFGTRSENRFGIAYYKFTGRFFIVMSVFGVLFYSVLIVFDLLR